MKKAITTAFVGVFFSLTPFVLTGCFGAPSLADAQQAPEEEKTNVQSSYEAEINKPEVETQRIGAEKYGYINIPASWAEHYDPNSSPDAIQYTNGAGAVITLNLLENAIDPKTTIANLVQFHEENGAIEVTTAETTLAGDSVQQLYSFYSEAGIYLVTWIWNGSDGVTHYVCAEGTAMDMMNAVAMIEETYSYKK